MSEATSEKHIKRLQQHIRRLETALYKAGIEARKGSAESAFEIINATGIYGEAKLCAETYASDAGAATQPTPELERERTGQP